MAALPFSNEFRQMLGNRLTLLYRATQLETAEATANLNAAEKILMFGFPDGLWDWASNLPVARKGNTTSSVSVERNGRNELLIDCPVYPGSSGLPVCLFSTSGSRLSVEHRLVPTNQVMLRDVVTAAMLDVNHARGRWLADVALPRSAGEGGNSDTGTWTA